MKPGNAPLKSIRLLDQVHERIRYLHCRLSTEKVYLYWVKFFVRWQAQQTGGMRHPRDMGPREVDAFLTMLATERKVSASTHNQALSAILFLYREVLAIQLPVVVKVVVAFLLVSQAVFRVASGSLSVAVFGLRYTSSI